MKQKTIVRVMIAVFAVVLIVGSYYYFTVYKSVGAENNVELTEVQEVITKDLKDNYPATPREVVKCYNRIQECFYNESYTDEELYDLGDQARMLMDEELLANNPRDPYFDALKADIDEFEEKDIKIVSSDVCDSNDVQYQKIDGDECAYVTASYFLDEAKSYSRTYQMYVLRKDEDGNWKILVFYQVEGDSSK